MDMVEELRRREVRDYFAGLSSEERYLALESAMQVADLETLHAVVLAPTLRAGIATHAQRERVRRELWRAVRAERASSQERMADPLETFALTLETLRPQMERLTDGEQSHFAQFEGERIRASEFKSAWDAV